MYGKLANNESNLDGLYIVWQPGANEPPRYTYSSKEDAVKVAHIMAEKNHGKQFAVMKVVGSVKPPKETPKFVDYDAPKAATAQVPNSWRNAYPGLEYWMTNSIQAAQQNRKGY